jgi:predicted Zn-dependent protease
MICAAVSLTFAVFAGSSPPVAADGLPELGDASRVDLSPQLERKIGERIFNDIRVREPSYVDDPEINDYLNLLGGRLVAASSNPAGRFLFFRDS